jgi:beta-N-acetylhexosaminidase
MNKNDASIILESQAHFFYTDIPMNPSRVRLVFFVTFSILTGILFFSCGLSPIRHDDAAVRESRRLVSLMSVDEKASQTLMAGISGSERFSPSLKDSFRDAVPGAILLFRYNIASTPEAVHAFTQSCNDAFESLGSRVPVAFAIDNEGGDVYRTGSLTFRLPSAAWVASSLDAGTAEKLYEYSARELSLMGIRMNLAPVVESLTDDNAGFLGSRSWSGDPDVVVKYSSAAIRGNRAGGMISVLKHFPGTGAGDPHRGDSILNASESDFNRLHLEPFHRVLKENPEAILVSHCVVPSIDPDTPFCISTKGVSGILRNRLKYSGVVITDDVAMKALASRGLSPGKAAELALRAGCDMVMTSGGDIRSVRNAIADAAKDDPVFAARLDEAVARIIAMKIRSGLLGLATGAGSFDEKSFFAARNAGQMILEETNGKK